MTMKPTTNAEGLSNSLAKEVLASAVLEKMLPELLAIPVEQLVPITTDLVAGITLVLGNLPEIMKLRADIAKAIPEYDMSSFDRLEERAMALYDAHGRYLIARKPADELDAAEAEGAKLRDMLVADAKALATRGLLDRSKLEELLGTVGRKNLAVDLNVLYQALTEVWPQVQGSTAATVENLQQAAKLSLLILRLVGLREQGTAKVAEATNIRLRANTCFTRGYDDVRRAVTFMRWKENDFDKIAPSLYSGRRRKNSDSETDDTGDVPPGTAAESTTGVPAGSQASDGSHASPGASTSLVSPEQPDEDSATAGTSGAPGTPGADPFLR